MATRFQKRSGAGWIVVPARSQGLVFIREALVLIFHQLYLRVLKVAVMILAVSAAAILSLAISVP